MKAPAPVLAVDATVLVAAALGKSTGAINQVASAASLVTTDRAIEEARRRVELGMKRPELLPVLDLLAAGMAVIPVTALVAYHARGEIALRHSVPSRNGSVKDAHMIALAWSYDADIWSTDRDFAGTGVASWSTPNLLAAFAQAGLRSI